MKTTVSLFSKLVIILMIINASACELAPLPPKPIPLNKAPNQVEFNVENFQTNLEIGLGNQWVGYAYVVNRNGQMAGSGTFGNWTRGGDGNAAADLTTPIYLASANKAITSVAIFRAMQEFGNGVPAMLNKSIETYIPSYWQRGSEIQELRFWDLLTHKSGFLTNASTSYSDITSTSMFDNTVQRNSPYQYSNLNFSMLMYLLPKMIGVELLGSDAQKEQTALQTFDSFVRSRIFQPAGITSATTIGSSALYYQWGALPQIPGWDTGDRTSFLGRGGYYMSAIDVARFLAFLNHSNQILNPVSRSLMYLNAAGWSDGNDSRLNPLLGDRGTYFVKGGSLCNATDRFGNCLGQGVRTIIMVFPDDIEVVILANNRAGANNGNLTNILRTAYDDSWN